MSENSRKSGKIRTETWTNDCSCCIVLPFVSMSCLYCLLINTCYTWLMCSFALTSYAQWQGKHGNWLHSMDLPTRPAVFGVARSGPHGKKPVFPTCSFADEKRKWPMLGVGCKLQNLENTSIWRNRGGWNQLAAEMCENKLTARNVGYPGYPGSYTLLFRV